MARRRSGRLILGAALAVGLLVGGDALAVVGRPLTPVSYAGVARRTSRRSSYAHGGSYYGAGYGAGAAAVVGTTAIAAGALATLPSGCAVGMPCAGVVYQPQYQGTTVVYVPQ